MKKTQIILFGIIAIGIAMLIMASKDVSSYANFDMAKEGDRVKIVGELAKEKEMNYNPDKDPNYFSFYLKDADGKESMVVYNKPKPQDFELSEQVVVTGEMQDDVFYADEILMKCPSKYKNEELEFRKG